MLTIKQKEPEGWERAFSVVLGEKVIATFRYRDSADAYIRGYFSN